MNIASLIAYCREHGIEFCLGEGTVRVRGSSGIIGEILPILRERKSEIIEYLSMELAHACETYGLYCDRRPPFPRATAEFALLETRSLLSRVMSKSA